MHCEICKLGEKLWKPAGSLMTFTSSKQDEKGSTDEITWVPHGHATAPPPKSFLENCGAWLFPSFRYFLPDVSYPLSSLHQFWCGGLEWTLVCERLGFKFWPCLLSFMSFSFLNCNIGIAPIWGLLWGLKEIMHSACYLASI